MKKPFKINVLFESFVGEANGVYTAFLEVISALKKDPDILVTINSSPKDCDIIHAQSIGLNYIWTAIRYGKKMVTSAHVVPDSFIGSLVLSAWWRPFAKAYLRWAFSLPKLVIAVSPIVKEELVKIGVSSQIEVLCNAVDREKFKPNPEARKRIREKHGLKEDAFIALSVGQIQPRKGIYDFLETARKCPDITFAWVGGRPYGRLTADFDRLTHEVDNAPANVKFLGTIDFKEMPDYYAMADVYFFPSYQENFAYATIEASAAQLPLLLRDNVEYPGTLFTHYLKGQDAGEFANALSQLKEDPQYLFKWQQESDTLASQYEITAYKEKLLAIYHSI